MTPASRPTAFSIRPDAAELDALRRELGLVELRKVALEGELRPLGRTDWEFGARLGATAVQTCVATLEPVTTRVETEVTRQYVADFVEPGEGETEMPEDDTIEPLGAYIDPAAVLAEALSLALPTYPRKPDAEPVAYQVTEPGKTPMTDEDTKPFAGLAALRDALDDDGQK